jgi:hypothetical protein
MARSPDEPEVVNVMLQKAVDISIALTGTDHGSLIFLDSDGSVVDSILSRGDISDHLKTRITATQMAMVLENTCLFSNLSKSLQSLGKANQKIEAYSRALDKELENCRQIQKSFLPKHLPELPGWDFAEFFFPARHISDDFYDAFMLPGDYIGLAIGDVCDKGVGSALFRRLLNEHFQNDNNGTYFGIAWSILRLC